MDITKNNIDDLNAVVTVKIEKKDYEEQVEHILKDYKKKLRLDGFRPGMVPMGMIKKMYRTPVLVEEVNKLLSENLSKYLTDEKLNILGEPLPHKDENEEKKSIDWETSEEFEFSFDLGLAPEYEVTVSSKDKIPWYKINIDNKLRDEYKRTYANRYGELKERDSVEDESVLKVELTELDEAKNTKENGIHLPEGTISLGQMKDDKTKKKIVGLKKDDSLDMNLKEAYPNETDLASLLQIEKEKLAEVGPFFHIKIIEIKKFEAAEINQELYDKIFGKDVVTSDKEFIDKIDQEISGNLERDSDYKFKVDTKEKFIKKFKKELPEEFLKRWIKTTNKEKISDEQLEKDFAGFMDDLKWELTKSRIIKDNDIKVSDNEALDFAKELIRMQYMQYGMANIPDENLTSYATEYLKKEEERRRIYERKFEDKVFEFVKTQVKLDEKSISWEKFNKLLEK
jgi:trigger factor